MSSSGLRRSSLGKSGKLISSDWLPIAMNSVSPCEILRGANDVFKLLKIHLFSRHYFTGDRSSLLLAEYSGKRGRFAQSLPFLARINHQRQYHHWLTGRWPEQLFQF